MRNAHALMSDPNWTIAIMFHCTELLISPLPLKKRLLRMRSCHTTACLSQPSLMMVKCLITLSNSACAYCTTYCACAHARPPPACPSPPWWWWSAYSLYPTAYAFMPPHGLPVPALLDDGEVLLDEEGEDPQRGRVHVDQLDLLTWQHVDCGAIEKKYELMWLHFWIGISERRSAGSVQIVQIASSRTWIIICSWQFFFVYKNI